MKQTIYRITIALFATLGITACTHNNGDIGPWFGQWKLTAIAIDGQPDNDYPGNAFISFQASVVQVTCVKSTYYIVTYGSWSQSDDHLTLNFDNSDDAHPGDSYVYRPAEELRFDEPVVTLHIDKSSGSEAILSYVNSSGQTITYTLKKWG